MKKRLILLSGGLDSTCLLLNTIEKVKKIKEDYYNYISCISFNYGSKHNEIELQNSKRLCESLNIKLYVCRLDFIRENFKSNLLKNQEEVPYGHYEDKNMIKTVVPFRNGIMLSIATGLCESLGYHTVCIANHNGDHAIYPDCRKEFIVNMNKATIFGTYKQIKIESPFVNKRKEDVLRIGYNSLKELQMDENIIYNSYSCYEGNVGYQCGKCGTCTERKEAFKLAKIEDKTIYKE